MCYQKILIRNKRFTDVNSVSDDGILSRLDDTQFYHECPCGHCEACLQSKRDGYLLRALTEYSRSGENAVFATLTYDDLFLPRYQWEETPVFSDAIYTNTGDYLRPTGELDSFGNVKYVIGDILLHEPHCLVDNLQRVTSVWCKKHIQKFFKSLREKLVYDYGVSFLKIKRLETKNGHRCKTDDWRAYESSKPNFLRYLCVCERGSDRQYIDDYGHVRFATSRPHYHVLLFVNNSFFTSQYLFDVISKLWFYGNTKNLLIGSNPEEQRSSGRSPLKCMEYVTKYVVKDIDDKSCKIPFNSHSDLLNYSPFITLSKFFGATLLDNFTDKELIDIEVNGINMPSSDGLGRVIPLPVYYSDKTGNYLTIKSKVTELRKLDPIYSNGYYNVPTYSTNIYESHNSLVSPVDFGYEFVDCVKTRRYLTPKGTFLRAKRIKKRTDHYLNLYKSCKTLRHDTPFFHPFVDDVSEEDFTYFLSHLYLTKHFSEEYPLEDTIYKHFKEVEILISKQNRELHKIQYENNLSSAMSLKPKLFNNNYL